MPVDGDAVGCVVGDAVGYCDFQLVAGSSFNGWAWELALYSELEFVFNFLTLSFWERGVNYVPFMKYISRRTPSGL